MLFYNTFTSIIRNKDYLYEIIILYNSNKFFEDFGFLMQLSLNMCLCIDIIQTLKSPFEVARSRMKFYLIFSIITSFTLASCILIF